MSSGLLKLLGISQSTCQDIKDLAKRKNQPVLIKFRVDDGFIINPGQYKIDVFVKGPLFSYCRVGSYSHYWSSSNEVIAETGIRGPDRREVIDAQNKALEKAIEVATEFSKDGINVTIMGDSIDIAKERYEKYYRYRL